MSMLNGAGSSAIEAHARAVGGGGEDLRAVAAVDLDGVGAVAALGQIGVVARIPDHAVVAGLAEHLVVAVAAGERVVAVAAEQKVGALAAEEGVVARTAIDGQLRDPGRQCRGGDGVVAAAAVDDEGIVRALRAR